MAPNQTDLSQVKGALEIVVRRLDIVEAQIGPPGTIQDKPSMFDHWVQRLDNDGVVVDEGVARSTPCVCAELEDARHSEICWSKGVVGALNEEQKAAFCNPKQTHPLSEARKQQIIAFQDAAAVCRLEISDLPKGEEEGPWLDCMSRELRSRGQSL